MNLLIENQRYSCMELADSPFYIVFEDPDSKSLCSAYVTLTPPPYLSLQTSGNNSHRNLKPGWLNLGLCTHAAVEQ